MKAMQMMKRMEINSAGKGVVGIVADSAVGFGASFAIGQVYSRHSDKWYGKNAARLAAAGGKLGAIVASLVSGGHATFIGTGFNSVGQAGVNAIGLEMGLRMGRDAKGQKAVLVPKGMDTKQIAGATDMTSIGALGRAAAGKGLSWDQIEELAQSR